MKGKFSLIPVELLLIALLSVGCSAMSTASPSASDEVACTRLAYAVSLGMESEIWTTDYLEDRRIAQVEGGIRGLHWSPDGRYLSWTAYDYRTRQSSLWMLGTDDAKTPVVSETENLLAHWWSPDSKTLFVMEFDATDVRPLKAYGLSVNSQQHVPVWFETLPFDTFISFDISPDWQRVAYLQSGASVLIVQHRDGDSWRLDLPAGTQEFETIGWSQDGKWLAFGATSTDYRQTNIFISRPNGDELRQLTWGTGTRRVIGWSPSGSYLAFTLMDSDDANQLCYVDTQAPEGSSKCLQGVWAGGRLQWLSDDEWVLTTNRINGQWDIYRVSLTDERFINLTRDDSVESSLAVWISH